ncbi:ABC transporter permease [Homoserinibacter sp. YIM 151385]|uniref:ABC transporter permease n=1 Tax=Homoserinibacter sp. YIM 151385 TaxID=2985506 RepID=UPI0022F0246C|nr:ABC transporter permease [Homoserinibacter sp. YIM 151385]WBU37968.1 ABC transporter permease [Homoserinibacter sp. YIM 151385]
MPTTLALAGVHARANLLETLRIPIAVIGTAVFPALALVFFVVPNAERMGPAAATQAVISLAVFSLCVGSLFNFGLTIAEAREKPWDPYLRTLPASGAARILGHLVATGGLSLVSLVPLIAIGALLTPAEAELWRIALGLGVLALASLPFMLMGVAIGFSMPVKAAIAVIQVLFFALAFGGGLFVPPAAFPAWLDAISHALPTRHAREVVIWAVQGGEAPLWALLGSLAWTLGLGILSLLLFRRDEGRRFR